MNPKKSELKQLILRELGTKFDDQRESLSDIVQQVVGAKTVLLKSAKDIQGLGKVADKDLEDGKIPDLKMLELVKLYVTRAMDSLTIRATQLSQEEIRHRGRLEQADTQIKYLEKMYQSEEDRLIRFKAALESGNIVEDGDDYMISESSDRSNVMPIRPDGVRPGASIAQQRKAEEELEAQAQRLAHVDTEDKFKSKKKRKSRKTKGSSVDVAPDPG